MRVLVVQQWSLGRLVQLAPGRGPPSARHAGRAHAAACMRPAAGARARARRAGHRPRAAESCSHRVFFLKKTAFSTPVEGLHAVVVEKIHAFLKLREPTHQQPGHPPAHACAMGLMPGYLFV